MRLFLILFALLAACKSNENQGKESDAPIVFKSEKAPYELALEGPWELVDASALNSHADIAANYQNVLFFIVIPQTLPDIPGTPPPDALALKRASLSVLEEQIQDFKIDKQAPLKIADSTGHSVFASGLSEGSKVRYVATYLTRDTWGFQIVGWGPETHHTLLLAETDKILASWKFTDSKPQIQPDIQEPTAD